MKKIEETYFKFLSYFPIIVGIFSLIPFIGIVVILSLVGQLFMPVEKIYFEDKNLRIQSSFVGVLGSPEMKVYKKKMFFDERVDFEYILSNEIDSIDVNYREDSILITLFQLNEFDNIREKIGVKK